MQAPAEEHVLHALPHCIIKSTHRVSQYPVIAQFLDYIAIIRDQFCSYLDAVMETWLIHTARDCPLPENLHFKQARQTEQEGKLRHRAMKGAT